MSSKEPEKVKKTKAKKLVEPQYYKSATNIPTYNYKVYYMKPLEKIAYFLAAFIVGAAVGYLFYGGIGVDEFGEPTKLTWILNIGISSITGTIAGIMFIPIQRSRIIAKHIKKLKIQFRDFLEAFNTSLGAGKNVAESFNAVYEDLKIQYDDEAAILKELEIINSGMYNNVAVEDLLEDLGIRSGIDDIISFANVFKICYRKGGNIKDTVRSTHSILSEKMNILEDIETIVTSSKLEQNTMIIMPIFLIGMIKMMSPEFSENFATPTGIISTTIAIGLFAAAYFVGKAVLNIKV